MWTGLIAGLGLFVLILDAKTAIDGAMEGVQLCLRAVIPSLFPFFVLSFVFTGSLLGTRISFLRPLGKICGVPDGAEALLLLGLVGGYPVGAKAVCDAHRQGKINDSTARRLLGFCNNAGPAFVFGIAGMAFSSPVVPWALWLVHIGAALIVGVILPNRRRTHCSLELKSETSIHKALEQSLRTMATVCGWVVLFRVLRSVLDRWLFWAFPVWLQVLLSGVLELSNGCLLLSEISMNGIRFVLSSLLLSLGGLCVGMQTVSVTGSLGTGMYFPGKLMQGIISMLLAGVVQYLLFPKLECVQIPIFAYLVIILAGAIVYRQRIRKKVVAICG